MGAFNAESTTDQVIDGISLAGDIALVTGASSGLGVETSRALAAAGADEHQLDALDRFADAIGLAFQVTDDVLDEEADATQLGKTSGKDKAANKPTYVSLLGLDGAREEAERLLEEALAALQGFGASAHTLRELAKYIVQRGN